MPLDSRRRDASAPRARPASSSCSSRHRPSYSSLLLVVSPSSCYPASTSPMLVARHWMQCSPAGGRMGWRCVEGGSAGEGESARNEAECASASAARGDRDVDWRRHSSSDRRRRAAPPAGGRCGGKGEAYAAHASPLARTGGRHECCASVRGRAEEGMRAARGWTMGTGGGAGVGVRVGVRGETREQEKKPARSSERKEDASRSVARGGGWWGRGRLALNGTSWSGQQQRWGGGGGGGPGRQVYGRRGVRLRYADTSGPLAFAREVAIGVVYAGRGAGREEAGACAYGRRSRVDGEMRVRAGGRADPAFRRMATNPARRGPTVAGVHAQCTPSIRVARGRARHSLLCCSKLP
ncbi:hypothetical protein DFH09DRAFT_1436979 [Mycena vulgaris]|nr:hypothetical protein DFH09DRAFT_1436979 [Mycena vulgaris]